MTLKGPGEPDLRGMLVRFCRCSLCHVPYRLVPEDGEVCGWCGQAPEPGVVA